MRMKRGPRVQFISSQSSYRLTSTFQSLEACISVKLLNNNLKYDLQIDVWPRHPHNLSIPLNPEITDEAILKFVSSDEPLTRFLNLK